MNRTLFLQIISDFCELGDSESFREQAWTLRANPAGTLRALNQRMRVFALFFLLAITLTAEARIGETAIQFVDRYGAPKDTATTKMRDKNSPLLEGAIHHVYEYQGWKIRAAFLQLE
jgi:hypothetical protein